MKTKYRIFIRTSAIIHAFLLLFVFTVSAQDRYIRDTKFNGNEKTTAGQSRCIKVIEDGPHKGKIMVAGLFITYDQSWGTMYSSLARLNADGTLDETFWAECGHISIYDIAIQPDGYVIIGGSFSITKGGVTHRNIARLDLDGKIDNDFNASGGTSRGTSKNPSPGSTDHTVEALLIANGPDGSPKIWVGGVFELYGPDWVVANEPQRTGGLVVLNLDGTVFANPLVEDAPEVVPGMGSSGGGVYALSPTTDGKVLVGGEFGRIKGVYARRAVRMLNDGNLDPAFLQRGSIGVGPGGTVRAIAEQIQPDGTGEIIIAGNFTSYKDEIVGTTYTTGVNRIARLNYDGSLDNDFRMNVSAGFNSDKIFKILSDATGRLIIGGAFTEYNGPSGVTVNRIIRLLPDGIKDNDFDTGTGFTIKSPADGGSVIESSIMIFDLAFQEFATDPEGYILVAGNFEKYDNDIIQLHTIRLVNETELAAPLSNFSVKKENTNAVLTWKGAPEYNYTIERSYDGRNFTPVATLSGQDNYVYRDPLTQNGKIYYRLSIRSSNAPTNQQPEYSSILSVVNTGHFTAVLTRLSQDQVKVSIYAQAYTREELNLSLVNMSGQLLYEERLTLHGRQLEKVITIPVTMKNSLLILRSEKEKEPLEVIGLR